MTFSNEYFYGWLLCTWENPKYKNDHVIEYLTQGGAYNSNQMKFSITGFGKFKEFKPGLLLTPYMDENGTPLMALVGYKLSNEILDF